VNPSVEVPPGPPAYRDQWKQQFAEKFRAAGGAGEPQFIPMRQPDTPTLTDLPLPGAGKRPRIPPEYRVDSPTIHGPDAFAETVPGAPKRPRIPPEYRVDTPTTDPDSPDAFAPTKTQTIPPVDPHAVTKTDLPEAPTKPDLPDAPSKSPGGADFHGVVQNIEKGLGALGNAGKIASGVQKEREAAAKDGHDASARNAAENIVGSELGADAYNTGKKNSQDAIAKADKEGRSRWSAAGGALIKTAQDMSGITLVKQIFEEESGKEIKQAGDAGRDPSVLDAAGRTIVRAVGEKSGLNPVLDAGMYDAEADRQAGDTARRLQEKVKDDLEQGLKNTGALDRHMKELKNTGDIQDPAIRARLRELQAQYAGLRTQTQDTNNRTRGKVDESDPQLIAIRQAVDLLPENPAGVDMNEKPEPTKEEQMAAHDCSQYPHTKVGWNEHTEIPGCFCVDGFEFNETQTVCQPTMAAALGAKDCSGISGAHPMWSEGNHEAYCGCVQGYQMNTGNTACEPDRETQMRQADCSSYGNAVGAWNEGSHGVVCDCMAGFEWNASRTACVNSSQVQAVQANCSMFPNAVAYWDQGAGRSMCGCPGGYEWTTDNTACVPYGQDYSAAQNQNLPPQQGPPPFDPNAMMQMFNNAAQGNSGNNPPSNSDGGTNWGGGSVWAQGNGSNTGPPPPTTLPGLGPSGGNSGGGAPAGFTGWGGNTDSSGGGVSTTPGDCYSVLGQDYGCN